MSGGSPDWRLEPDPHAKEARRRAAYADLFGSLMGRLVLMDLLAMAGVGERTGPPLSERPSLLEYDAGRRDAVLDIAELAGLDRRTVLNLAMTADDELPTEDLTYERAADFDG